jgi:hypothetical protein
VLVQADVHDWLTLSVSGPTLDRTEWGKDPDLELSFDPVLDQIQYLAESGLTSLMVLTTSCRSASCLSRTGPTALHGCTPG